MTPGSAEALANAQPEARAPILVLGLGNLLLTDDGVGLRLLDALRDARPWSNRVEFVDGGTQGLVLLPYLEQREALLILDAVGLGAAPGSVHVLDGEAAVPGALRRAGSAHEGNAHELLALAHLLGQAPARVVIVGVEPHDMHTRIGLTTAVERAVPAAVKRACEELSLLLEQIAP